VPLEQGRYKMSILTHEQCIELLEKACAESPRLGALVSLALQSGLKPGDISPLKVEDVFDDGVVKSFIVKKSNTTGKSFRWPLHEETKRILRIYHEELLKIRDDKSKYNKAYDLDKRPLFKSQAPSAEGLGKSCVGKYHYDVNTMSQMLSVLSKKLCLSFPTNSNLLIRTQRSTPFGHEQKALLKPKKPRVQVKTPQLSKDIVTKDTSCLGAPEKIVDTFLQTSIRRIYDNRNLSLDGIAQEAFIDYTLEDLVFHLEASFSAGMSWDNYGNNGWVIDHVRPVASFVDENPRIAARRSLRITNIRPMWSEDNMKKSDDWVIDRKKRKEKGMTAAFESLKAEMSDLLERLSHFEEVYLSEKDKK